MKEYKNSAYKQDERLLLERAINALKKATGIDARIIQMEGIHRDPTKADATIDVDLAGVTFRYTVEIKRVDRFAAIALFIPGYIVSVSTRPRTIWLRAVAVRLPAPPTIAKKRKDLKKVISYAM